MNNTKINLTTRTPLRDAALRRPLSCLYTLMPVDSIQLSRLGGLMYLKEPID